MNRLTFVIVLVAALYPTVAWADSDGYYCIGKGYVAFETHSFRVANSHVLHLIRVSRSGGNSTFGADPARRVPGSRHDVS